jgi:hypothetical protein
MNSLSARLMLCALFTAACGASGDAESRGPDAPAASKTSSPASASASASPAGSGAAIPIRGTERLAWIQEEQTLASARALTFVLYVDGKSSPLPGVTCEAAGSQVECQAQIPRLGPGVHLLEIAAISDGREGGKSLSLTVEVLQSGATANPVPGALAAPSRPSMTAATETVICTNGGATTCFALDTLAEGLRDARGLTALPDGRPLWIEEERRLLIADDGGPQVAYDVRTGRDDAARLIGVAVDPSFAATRLVYAATVSRVTADESTLAIVRMREVGGVFGEAAVLVPGVPVPANEPPAMTIGSDGVLYVAIPAGGGSRRAPDGGLVLRFDPSGDAVGASRFATPVLSAGAAHPGMLAWSESRLWLTARDGPSGEAFAIVPITGLPDARPSAVSTPDGALEATGVGQLALVPGVHAATNTADAFFVTAQPSQLFGATIAYGDAGAPRIVATYPLPLGDLAARAIAVTPGRDLLALVSTPGAAATTALIRLRARTPPTR